MEANCQNMENIDKISSEYFFFIKQAIINQILYPYKQIQNSQNIHLSFPIPKKKKMSTANDKTACKGQ